MQSNEAVSGLLLQETVQSIIVRWLYGCGSFEEIVSLKII